MALLLDRRLAAQRKMRASLLLPGLFAGSLGLDVDTQLPVQVIVMAGQSNMQVRRCSDMHSPGTQEWMSCNYACPCAGSSCACP